MVIIRDNIEISPIYFKSECNYTHHGNPIFETEWEISFTEDVELPSRLLLAELLEDVGGIITNNLPNSVIVVFVHDSPKPVYNVAFWLKKQEQNLEMLINDWYNVI